MKVIDDLDEIQEIKRSEGDSWQVLSEMETRLLYQAKCKDLSIPNIESQYRKFRDFMQNNCTRRRFKMNGGQIGPTVAKVIALIIKSNPNFARYDLSHNKIGDVGIEAIAAVFR